MIITADVADEISDEPDTGQTTEKDTALDTETIIQIASILVFGMIIGFVVGRRRN